MATATARAPQPGNERARPVRPGQALANFVSNDTISTITQAARLQFLSKIYGISGDRGKLIASLYWGSHHEN